MNGKIKTKFAALFAVALMITVCVVPVVGNEDVQAASAAPEGVSGIEIQLFTEDSTDFSDMVYCSCDKMELPDSVDANEWMWQNGLWININEESEYFGTYLRYGQTGLTNEQIKGMSEGQNLGGKDFKWLPMIQISYKYTQDHDLSISVTKDGTDVKMDTGDMKVNKRNVAFGEVEAISTFKLVASENPEPAFSATDNEDATGLYDVQVSIDGVLVKEQTVDYFAEESYLTVSATIADASGSAITDKKPVVSYTVDGKALSKNTKDSGAFSIKVRPGSVVAITGISYPDDAYTFTGENGSFDYGTLKTTPTSKTFKANEKVGTIEIESANGTPIKGAEVSMAWWYEYTKENSKNETVYVVDDKIMKGGIAGVVNVLGVSNEEGIVKYTYIEPIIEKLVDDEDYPYAAYSLIASAKKANGYTFLTVEPDDMKDKSIDYCINDQKDDDGNDLSFPGTIIVTDTDYTLEAVELAESITVTSANGTPIKGAEVSMAWWYEYIKEKNEETVYDISNSVMKGGKKGVINVLGLSDKFGVVNYTYVEPDLNDVDDEDYPYAAYSLIASAEKADGYTFTTLSTKYLDETMDIQDNVAKEVYDVSVGDDVAAYPGTIIADSDNNILANETSYVISGEISGIDKVNGKYPEVSIKYTNGVGSSLTLGNDDVSENDNDEMVYKYSFQVIEGNSCVITPSIDGYVFTPVSITTPSATVAIPNVNFVAESTVKSVGFKEISGMGKTWTYTGFDDGDVVTFTYTVNGIQYAVPKVAESESASFTPTGFTGSYIELKAVTAEGYMIDLNSGTTAVEIDAVKILIVSGKAPVAGLDLTIMNNDKVVGTIKTDDKGTASLEIAGATNLYAVYDGIYKFPLSNTNPSLDEYYTADVGSKIPVAEVSIQYMSTYNKDNQSTIMPPVSNLEVAPGADVKASAGESIALKAPSIDNFEFVAWMVDGVVVSDKADYTLVVPAEGCDAVALYSAVHYEEPAEGLSMNVLVIGIVILILGILAVAYGIISKKQ